MQTIFFAYFYVARCRLTSRLPAEIVEGRRRASPGVGPRWLFVWLFRAILLGSAARVVARTGLAPVRSPQVALIGLAVSRVQETAGQSANYGHLALAIFSVGASWRVSPDTTETGVLTKPASRCRVEPFLGS